MLRERVYSGEQYPTEIWSVDEKGGMRGEMISMGGEILKSIKLQDFPRRPRDDHRESINLKPDISPELRKSVLYQSCKPILSRKFQRMRIKVSAKIERALVVDQQ